jgi:hypothetical protein
MKRAITNVILNPLAQELLSWSIIAWDTIVLSVDSEWELLVKK